jgi:hypothetical protein
VALKFFTPPAMPTPNILMIGPAKTGKTGGVASLAELDTRRDIYYVNADLENAVRYAHRTWNAHNNIKWIKPEGFQTLVDLTYAAESDNPPLAIVIDPIGDFYRIVLEDFSKRAVRPSLPSYGDASVHMERFCRKMCELDVIFVVVAHAFPVKDEATGEVTVYPFTGTQAGSAVLGSKLLGMVDVIGYTGVKYQEGQDPEYVSQLIAFQGRQGGDRFNCLGPVRPTQLSEWIRTIHSAEETAATVAKAAKPKAKTAAVKPAPTPTQPEEKAA